MKKAIIYTTILSLSLSLSNNTFAMGGEYSNEDSGHNKKSLNLLTVNSTWDLGISFKDDNNKHLGNISSKGKGTGVLSINNGGDNKLCGELLSSKDRRILSFEVNWGSNQSKNKIEYEMSKKNYGPKLLKGSDQKFIFKTFLSIALFNLLYHLIAGY